MSVCLPLKGKDALWDTSDLLEAMFMGQGNQPSVNLINTRAHEHTQAFFVDVEVTLTLCPIAQFGAEFVPTDNISIWNYRPQPTYTHTNIP